MIPARDFPAPYTPHPDRLLKFEDPWPALALARLQNPEIDAAPTDVIFIGDGTIHEARYDPSNPRAWIDNSEILLSHAHDKPLVGYFSYEFGYQFEPSRWQSLPIAAGQIMFRFFEATCWYKVDHSRKSAKIVIASGVDTGLANRFISFIHKHVPRTYKLVSHSRTGTPPAKQCSELSTAQYTHAVRQILEDIHAGRYYELNFTQRFHTQSPVPPAHLFSDLFTSLNPRYGWFGRFANESILSISPELFLHKRVSRVQTCPIKGSFTSQPTRAEQEKLSAEHIMVVDLARNDLGRISDKAWVSVAEMSGIRQFGALSHLESRIVGETSLSLQEILAATYPAASITGTPKVETVQAIAQYESSSRGVYTGSAGVIWPDGDFQLNVAIRTLSAKPDHLQQWQYTLGAGGAIIAGSNPEQEHKECLEKVKPLLAKL